MNTNTAAAPATPRRRKAEYVTAEREVKVARISVDQATVDRIRWCECVAEYLGIKTAAAVILRRALQSYVRELEKLLKQADDGRERAEAVCLRRAAKGDTQKLPDAALEAYPPRPFSVIEAEESKRQADKLKARPLEPFDPEGFRRG